MIDFITGMSIGLFVFSYGYWMGRQKIFGAWGIRDE